MAIIILIMEAILGLSILVLIAVVLVKRFRENKAKKQSEEEERRDWEKQLEEIRQKEKEEKEERERKKEEKERMLKDLYSNAPEDYFSTLLEKAIIKRVKKDKSFYPVKVDALFSEGILGLECRMPNKNEVSRVKETYRLKNGEKREKLWSNRDFPKVYEDYLYSLCLNLVNTAFNLDKNGIVQSVLFNGYVIDHSPITGQLESTIIMSLLGNKEQFAALDFEHIDPKACFRHLKGVSAAKLIDVSPITPVLTLDTKDHRFVESREVTTNEGMNLAAMDWEEFEHLVRQLFELEFSKNGGEVRVTQASRDGGVDAIIFDPDPLRGGKIVVQAKRYTNTVGVSAVRDLYGTVINEGANSGILITTSDYGHDSYEFAKDKPLKLLNSGHLLALLQKNGMKGYINIQEAKKTLKENGE